MANSKKPKGSPPAPARASLTITFTGLPESASREPACAAKASGISIWEGW